MLTDAVRVTFIMNVAGGPWWMRDDVTAAVGIIIFAPRQTTNSVLRVVRRRLKTSRRSRPLRLRR